MSDSAHLIIHNIFSLLSVISGIGFGLFIYLNDRKSKLNITMAMVFVGAAIFSLSHLIGVNVADPELSRNVFMFNLVVFFIAAFQVHAAYVFTGNTSKSSKVIISCFYISAIILTIFFALNKDLMFHASVSKMYFPNYYDASSLTLVRTFFLQFLAVPFSMYVLIKKSRSVTDVTQKRQYKFFIWTLLIGHGLGVIPNFLVHNIQIDPAFGMMFSFLSIIPAMYGSVKYELFSVKVIAKQAIFYSIAVVLMGGVITILNYIDQVLRSNVPDFPVWALPLLSSVAAISVGVVVWKNLRESDIMKSEFISIVTHKFRTPLTHIKWSSENLSKSTLDSDQGDHLRYIQTANEKLVELTDLLVTVSSTERTDLIYRYENMDISELAKETITNVLNQIDSRKIKADVNLTPDLIANIDTPRIRFVMQTFIENAIHYGGADPRIEVKTSKDSNHVTFRVTDHGIGITKDTLPFLFQKFYRGKEARLADTEGMGIGLFMAKKIIQRHKGKIGAESNGANKGSTFYFSIPLVRK